MTPMEIFIQTQQMAAVGAVIGAATTRVLSSVKPCLLVPTQMGYNVHSKRKLSGI
jgi:hypothetical protein